jgi:cytochrome c556
LLTRSITLQIAAAFIGLNAAFAGGDNAIIARKACMKAQGAAVIGLFFPISRGEKPYDGAGIDSAFENMERACAKWAEFWPEDSKTGEVMETGAKADIWLDSAGFAKVSSDAEAALTALRAAKDEASFKAALPAVGATCQGCHERYRVKID